MSFSDKAVIGAASGTPRAASSTTPRQRTLSGRVRSLSGRAKDSTEGGAADPAQDSKPEVVPVRSRVSMGDEGDAPAAPGSAVHADAAPPTGHGAGLFDEGDEPRRPEDDEDIGATAFGGGGAFGESGFGAELTSDEVGDAAAALAAAFATPAPGHSCRAKSAKLSEEKEKVPVDELLAAVEDDDVRQLMSLITSAGADINETLPKGQWPADTSLLIRACQLRRTQAALPGGKGSAASR